MIPWWWLLVEPWLLGAIGAAIFYCLLPPSGPPDGPAGESWDGRGVPPVIRRGELPPSRPATGLSCKTRDGLCRYGGCKARGTCLGAVAPALRRG